MGEEWAGGFDFTGSERIQSMSPTEAPGKLGGSALLFGHGSNKAILCLENIKKLIS